MKFKKLAEFLLITCFICFLGAMMFFTVENRDTEYSYYENRNYAVMPEASEKTFWDGTYFTEMDNFLNDHAAFRNFLVKIQNYIDVNIIKRPVLYDVVITDEVLLPYNNFETVVDAEMKQKAETIASMNKELNEVIESYGGHYIYTAVPCQYASYEDEYPFYLNSRSEYTELEIKYLKEAMANAGVEFVDMLEIFENTAGQGEGDNLYYSSRIDNHYDIRGGYVVYKTLIDKLNGETSLELRFPSDDEIVFTPYELPYRGSRARKLMDVTSFEEYIYRADFTEPVEFTRYDNGTHVTSYIYHEKYAVMEDMVTYGYYMGGDIAETVIDTDRPELPSILIYGDSFTNTLEALAYYSFDEMRSLDLRYYTGMHIQDYILKYKPDVVICVRDYQALLAPAGNGRITK